MDRLADSSESLAFQVCFRNFEKMRYLTLLLQQSIPAPIQIKCDSHTVQSWSLVRLNEHDKSTYEHEYINLHHTYIYQRNIRFVYICLKL